MSIIVKGMKMPKNCAHCLLCGDESGRYCAAANEYIPMLGKPKWCPLVEVPTPHGRLVDADALFREMEKAQWYNNADRDEIAEELVLNAPTIESRCEACEAFNKTRLLIPQPQRKKGEWIDSHTTCSECGWQMIDDVIESPNIVAFNFCPNCGADMREDGATNADVES